MEPLPAPLNFYVPGPVRVQGVDNCLLLHGMGESRLTMVYDVKEEEETAGATEGRDPFCGGGPVAYGEGGGGEGEEKAFYNPRCARVPVCCGVWTPGGWTDRAQKELTDLKANAWCCCTDT